MNHSSDPMNHSSDPMTHSRPYHEGCNQQIAQKTAQIEEELKGMGQKGALEQVWKERKELEELLHSHELTLMIAGNIGFGKTTVTGIIGTYGKICEIEEPVDNPVLKWYYDDMRSYSERLQLDLINVRLHDVIINKMKHPHQSLIFDRTHYEDPYIFCEVLTKSELMTPDENAFCKKYFHMKMEQLEGRYNVKLVPDLIIFLQGDIETGWKRVQGRERAIEVREDAGKGVGLAREFYEALHREYEQFSRKLDEIYSGPLVVLSQDAVEVADATNSKGQLYVIKSVKEAIKIAFG